MKTIKEFNVSNKKVLVRCDLNISLSENRSILDDFRIKKSIPTIKYLLKNNARQIVLMSHLGRPKKVDSNFSLEILVPRLEELIQEKVFLLKDYDNLKSIENENKFYISPNPFSTKTTINFHNPNLSNCKLSIFSISGNKVFEMDNIKSDKIEFERGNLSKGIYIVELKGEKFYNNEMLIIK